MLCTIVVKFNAPRSPLVMTFLTLREENRSVHLGYYVKKESCLCTLFFYSQMFQSEISYVHVKSVIFLSKNLEAVELTLNCQNIETSFYFMIYSAVHMFSFKLKKRRYLVSTLKKNEMKHTSTFLKLDIILIDLWRSLCGVAVNVRDYNSEVNEFELQSRYYVHFRAYIMRKGMNSLIPHEIG